jgi:hypothetical protein
MHGPLVEQRQNSQAHVTSATAPTSHRGLAVLVFMSVAVADTVASTSAARAAIKLIHFTAFDDSRSPIWRLIEFSISHIVSFR